jgi:hypothetical protein
MQSVNGSAKSTPPYAATMPYYGVAGNFRSLVKVYRVVERYWRRMLCSRSWAGHRLTWDAFNQVKERTPLLQPKLRLPYSELQALAVL